MSHETRIQHKSSFLTEQLVEERARKTSFETRGMAVISASGTLVGITTGAVALAASGRSVTFPESARLLLVAAMVMLVLAAVLGLLINVPVRLPQADTGDLTQLLEPTARFGPDDWNRVKRDTIVALRRVNRRRARSLLAALLLVVVALVLMMASAAFALRLFPA
ncbi:hypothetical protein AN217_10695 [Streptomyces qinglanensis]|uniref:Integral membrane plasmid transfer protein n=1 Tax=Streptomyces qinglanensis TaxID=943816 RepID=A0A1E7K2Z4_9ACTN|nr:hypothetical protein [Streptomyces qinglanensis]OEU98216.1 hypothetical protein AN217_10695 [Streptomyces qinglanensis]OEV07277.1 hypothetical protein AN220_34660 [Streptomyces nanshensis]